MDTGLNIPIERIEAKESVKLNAVLLDLLDHRRTDRIPVVIFRGKFLTSGVIDAKSRRAEGEESRQLSSLGVKVCGITLLVTLLRTGRQAEIQTGVLMQ